MILDGRAVVKATGNLLKDKDDGTKREGIFKNGEIALSTYPNTQRYEHKRIHKTFRLMS